MTPGMPHPTKTPLEKWPQGWLVMEVASLLDTPGYILMHEHERRKAGYPVTVDDMREFIRGRREADALLANPELIDKEEG
jgi:hypothetical protein